MRGDKQDDPLGQVHANNDEAAVQARLFSTSQNSLLNPQRPIGSPDRTYRISLAVYDRKSGLYVWRGSAMRNDPNLDVTQASNEMIAAPDRRGRQVRDAGPTGGRIATAPRRARSRSGTAAFRRTAKSR